MKNPLSLIITALTKFLAGFLLLSFLLFLPAGTIHWPRAWLLIGILFLPMLAVGVVLFLKNPGLLQKRLDAKESRKTQSSLVRASGVMFLLGFIAAGLDFRFSWFPLPVGVSIAAAVLFLCGYAMYAEVLRENTYLARTIRVEDGQRVIDTGLYGVIRHPMYAATVLMFCSMPLVLGSGIAFVTFLVYPLILSKRIGNEEELLRRELAGYEEYTRKVKYRMIPYLW